MNPLRRVRRLSTISPGIAARHTVGIKTPDPDVRIEISHPFFPVALEPAIGNGQLHERPVILRTPGTSLGRFRIAPKDPEAANPIEREGHRPAKDNTLC
jgi:hypothetical protein